MTSSVACVKLLYTVSTYFKYLSIYLYLDSIQTRTAERFPRDTLYKNPRLEGKTM